MKNKTIIILALFTSILFVTTTVHADEVEHLGTITVTAGKERTSFKINAKYKHVFGNYAGENAFGNGTKSFKIQNSVSNTTKAQSYHVVVPKSDFHHNVDLTNLSEADVLMFNHYAFKIVNNLRRQFGNTPVRVSPFAQQFAMAVNQAYEQDNFSASNGHDIPAINRVAKQFHMHYDASNQSQYYENSAYWGLFDASYVKCVPVATVKAFIWYTIGTMMFEDRLEGYNHAINLAGFRDDQDAPVLGFISIDNLGNLHVQTISRNSIDKPYQKYAYSMHY